MSTDTELRATVLHAWDVAKGQVEGEETARRIRGALNDYNSRGRGSTMARRVLRDGTWDWVSAPASRGRHLAGDRRDVQWGDVYEGEIIAEYTLGSKRPRPNSFGWCYPRPKRSPSTGWKT